MSETKGVYKSTLPNGMEVAYVDKGVGKPLGIPRESYESNGYSPSYDDLPEK